MIAYVPASPAHIGRIANAMSHWDRVECEAGGRSPKEALRMSLRGSVMAWTAIINGRPEAMWGATPTNLIEGEGSPWMLGTDEARCHARAFYTCGTRTFPIMRRCFPKLRNEVAVGNKPAVRLLTRWGFIVGGEIRTRGGVEFVPFWMEN